MSRSTKKLPFHRPSIGRREIRAVSKVLKSGWLTTGAQAKAFEDEFAAFLAPGESTIKTAESKKEPLQALAVNSATSGLHLSLEAAGVGPGDTVAVPSLTFTASAEVIRYLGADPLFIDSESTTGNLCPRDLGRKVERLSKANKNLKAIIVVHLAGYPCDMTAIKNVLSGETVIIEDAAHAFPCRSAEGTAGLIGDIGVFSFYATKTITTGEGGMVCTRNPNYAARMRTMRLHGIDRDVWNRYREGAAAASWVYDVAAPGYKYNMTDIAAAIGREQLKKADSLLASRVKLAAAYNSGLKDIPGIELPPEIRGHSWHLYILRFMRAEDRDRAAQALADKGIGISVHFIPLHRMSYWEESSDLSKNDFPGAESLADRILSLPLWPGMSNSDQRRVVKVLREILHG